MRILVLRRGENLGHSWAGRRESRCSVPRRLTEHFATQLGLDPTQVTAMHPARQSGHALQISAITKQARHAWPIVPISWTYLRQPRTCDQCVSQ